MIGCVVRPDDNTRPPRRGTVGPTCVEVALGTSRGRRCTALLCAYDGGAFSGFQRQPPLPTVQGALEAGLNALRLHARVEASGRTDSGVHARRQIVSLRSEGPLPAAELPRLLARHLPRALSVLAAREVDFSFHARHSAVAKLYRYRLSTSPAPGSWERRFAWTLPDPRGFPGLQAPVTLDLDALREALAACTGRRDFSLLVHPRASGKRVRLLTRAELQVTGAPGGGQLISVTLAAPGFLRHQIRNVMGVAVTAALGLLPPGELARLVAGEGDRFRGARAPGRGLTLWDVQYRRGEDPFRGAAEGPPPVEGEAPRELPPLPEDGGEEDDGE